MHFDVSLHTALRYVGWLSDLRLEETSPGHWGVFATVTGAPTSEQWGNVIPRPAEGSRFQLSTVGYRDQTEAEAVLSDWTAKLADSEGLEKAQKDIDVWRTKQKKEADTLRRIEATQEWVTDLRPEQIGNGVWEVIGTVTEAPIGSGIEPGQMVRLSDCRFTDDQWPQDGRYQERIQTGWDHAAFLINSCQQICRDRESFEMRQQQLELLDSWSLWFSELQVETLSMEEVVDQDQPCAWIAGVVRDREKRRQLQEKLGCRIRLGELVRIPECEFEQRDVAVDLLRRWAQGGAGPWEQQSRTIQPERDRASEFVVI